MVFRPELVKPSKNSIPNNRLCEKEILAVLTYQHLLYCAPFICVQKCNDCGFVFNPLFYYLVYAQNRRNSLFKGVVPIPHMNTLITNRANSAEK